MTQPTAPDQHSSPGRRSLRDRDVADEPVLPTRSSEDSAQAWGDDDGRRDEDWYQRERPPHHE